MWTTNGTRDDIKRVFGTSEMVKIEIAAREIG
jgi:hypothetical protein